MEILKKSKISLLTVLSLLIVSCSHETPIDNTDSFSDREIFEGLFFGAGKVAQNIPSIDNQYVSYVLDNINEEERLAIDKFKNDIYSQLKANRPTELSRLFKNLKSGDNELILKELKLFSQIYYSELLLSKEYGKYFKRAAVELSKIKKADIINGKFKNLVFDSEKAKNSSNTKSKLMSNDEALTTLGAAPVICFTLIVWNYGVVVNVGAAVNVAIGVNLGVLLNVAVGVNVGVNESVEAPDNSVDHEIIYEEPVELKLEQEILINEISELLYVAP